MISSLGMESVVQLHRNSPSSSVVITNPTTANITSATAAPLNTNTSCSASSSFNMQQHNKNNSTPSPPTGANKRKQPTELFTMICRRIIWTMTAHPRQKIWQMTTSSSSCPACLNQQWRQSCKCGELFGGTKGFSKAYFTIIRLRPAQRIPPKHPFPLPGCSSTATGSASTTIQDSEVGREGSTASSSRVSERLEEDEDSETCLGNGVEPEDLSLCKERKLEVDESGCATAASNWSYEEQFKQSSPFLPSTQLTHSNGTSS
uniref:Uncharacterized protein n=1 Tax=Ditylenchus dipsaci TaxID=166011 RepID=A0A915EU56_9BILA